MYISNKFSHHICDKLLEQEIIQANTYPYYQYSFDYVLDLILFHSSGFITSSIITRSMSANIDKLCVGKEYMGNPLFENLF